MKRAAVLVGILALALAPCTALAQDFLGVGPYFGLGGTSSSGEVKAKPPCVLYVGYSGDPGSSTAFNIYAQGIGLYSTMDIAFTYAVRGLWLGASQTLGLSDHVGVVGSFWYLFPDRAVESRQTEVVGSSVSTDRNWKTDTQWWYADLLGALGNLNGFSLLAGFRYDFFTTRFKNPYDYFGRTLGTDTADVKSNGYIPLVGGQVAYAGSCGSLLFRLVGFPTLLGQVTYNQTVGGWSRREASGNYNGQYFMEAFAEYAYVLTRTADLGIFARFNSTHGTANVNVEAVFPGQGVVRADTFSLGATRNNWTAGGRMNLRF